mgnify:CR=1 FL=1
MILRDYMHFNRLSCKELAKVLDIHPVYLSAIKNGKRKPGYELSLKIYIFTGGNVDVKDLR